MKQKTIIRPIKCSGIGIHTGTESHLTFKPAEANSGIHFVRTDIESRPRIPADIDHVSSVVRGTTIGINEIKVHTIEHVLAAVTTLGIDNLLIEIDGIEPPAGDGSSLCFFNALEEAGITEQEAVRKEAVLTEPFTYEEDGVSFLVLPHHNLKISFHIEYSNPLVGFQFESVEINARNFREKLAEARTFTFLRDVKKLQESGLIKGGTLENAVVIGEDKILNEEPLRSPNEFVRHKIVDLLGDICLLGMPLKAHVISSRSGHPSNISLVRKLRDHLSNQKGANVQAIGVTRKLQTLPTSVETKLTGMSIRQVMEKIPHRYPFLLVDRIVEFQAEKRAVGIKNVSVNEPFFQGHFPGHPIMPGVLIVEAMGQTGGMLLMNSVPLPENKVLYFMSLDKVKFRKPVFPGDQLRLELEMLRFKHRICKMKGCGYVGSDLVAEAEMTAVIMDRESPTER